LKISFIFLNIRIHLVSEELKIIVCSSSTSFPLVHMYHQTSQECHIKILEAQNYGWPDMTQPQQQQLDGL